MEPQQAFGAVLKQSRLKAGLSQEELALECDLDRTFISLMERGKRKPTINTIFTIASVLSIKPSQFVKEVEKLVEQSPRW
jgi:transcriptional regulator with XRE-family HTH domain